MSRSSDTPAENETDCSLCVSRILTDFLLAAAFRPPFKESIYLGKAERANRHNCGQTFRWRVHSLQLPAMDAVVERRSTGVVLRGDYIACFVKKEISNPEERFVIMHTHSQDCFLFSEQDFQTDEIILKIVDATVMSCAEFFSLALNYDGRMLGRLVSLRNSYVHTSLEILNL